MWEVYVVFVALFTGQCAAYFNPFSDDLRIAAQRYCTDPYYWYGVYGWIGYWNVAPIWDFSNVFCSDPIR